MEDVLGPSGSRTLDAWHVGWSIDVAEAVGAPGRSVARTAVFTIRPAPTSPSTPPEEGDAPPGDVTPGDGPKVPGVVLPADPLLGRHAKVEGAKAGT